METISSDFHRAVVADWGHMKEHCYSVQSKKLRPGNHWKDHNVVSTDEADETALLESDAWGILYNANQYAIFHKGMIMRKNYSFKDHNSAQIYFPLILYRLIVFTSTPS